MSDLASVIEALEHRWMRAWIAGDVRTLRLLTSPRFRMVFATKPCVILDAASWLKAAADRFHCDSYRFGDIYVSKCGSVAVFAQRVISRVHESAEVSRSVASLQLWR